MSDVSALADDRRLQRLLHDAEALVYRAGVVPTADLAELLLPGLCVVVMGLVDEVAQLQRALARERIARVQGMVNERQRRGE